MPLFPGRSPRRLLDRFLAGFLDRFRVRLLVPPLAVAVALALLPQETAALEALPPLIAAAKQADSARALALIADGAEVDGAEADGTTALHWAVRAGDGVLVAALLDAGANPNAVNRYGLTPQHLAAENGDVNALRALLDAGADPNAFLPEGETVLMTAARTGDPESLRVLLEHGADLTARENWYGETALIWAAAEDHADAIRVLAERGADIDQRSAKQAFERRRLGQSILPLGEWTALMYAARENALAAGRALAVSGADLDLVDPDGASALAIAIINAHYEFAAMLLDAGADPNIVDASGMGPLYAAVDMHRLAVGHGRPNPKPAGALDSVESVAMLLGHGADPNAELSKPIIQRHHTAGDASLGEGATPLLRAAKSGDVAVMRLLLAAGADPMHTMPDGSTAVTYAAGRGWRNGSPLAPSYDQGSEQEAVDAIVLLREAGLDVDMPDHDGNTALHAAIMGRGSEVIIRYLVGEAGADLSARNANGQTPLAAAQAKRSGEALVVLLESLGAIDAGGTATRPD